MVKFMLKDNNKGIASDYLLEIYKPFDCRYPSSIYLLKFNNRNTRTKCEIYSNLTIKTPERRHWRRSGVFFVNFEHI